MGIATIVKDKLETDLSLIVLANGGIYDWDETGQRGLSVSSTPNAFEDGGVRIKPTILVKARSKVPTSNIVDEQAQLTSYRQTIEVYFYEEHGYNKIEALMQRAYELLQAKKLAVNFGPMFLMMTIEGVQAEDLGGANMSRMDFVLYNELKPTT